MVDRETKLCISIATKASNFGASMHNAGYASLDLNYVYLPVATTDTHGAVVAMRALNIRGMSVSVPHKQTIMPMLDEVDEIAREIGAVNTVINEDGRLVGRNYDWIGVVKALEEVTTIKGKTVALLGAGGAARAIVYGLRKAGALVDVYNRDQSRGRQLVEALGGNFKGALTDARSLQCDVLINATSVGSQTKEMPLPPECIPEQCIVMDIVPLPVQTEFIKAAKSKGCTTVAGVRMLVHQASRQFEDYTGSKASIEVMEKALMKAIENS